MPHRIITILLVLMMLPASLAAQQRNGSNKPSHQDRETWMKEMQQVKTNFIVKKLALNKEKKEKFVQVYTRMENELRTVNEQTRKQVRNANRKDVNVTDAEKEKAAVAEFELKSKEGAIEKKFYKEFREFLTLEQLLILKHAEREFSREIMSIHRNNTPPKHKPTPVKAQKKD